MIIEKYVAIFIAGGICFYCARGIVNGIKLRLVLRKFANRNIDEAILLAGSAADSITLKRTERVEMVNVGNNICPACGEAESATHICCSTCIYCTDKHIQMCEQECMVDGHSKYKRKG